MQSSKDYLGKLVDVKVDKMLGSKHSEKYPNHIYPVNYGYVPNTISGDGKELDCYILGVYEPVIEFSGRCIAIIHRLSEDDDKLIIVPDGRTFTNKEIRVLTEFQERFFESIGYNKNVVILTQPAGYTKKSSMGHKLTTAIVSIKRPGMAKTLKKRPEMYNETLKYIEEREASNSVFVIRPPESLNISRTERNPKELHRVYMMGRREGKRVLADLKRYLNI